MKPSKGIIMTNAYILLVIPFFILHIFVMKYTYSIAGAQAKLPGIVREAQDSPVVITRHDKTVAYVISKKQMDSIRETLEFLANPAAMKAIRASRDRKTKYIPLNEIDES
jgi:prevent-host-death family protein